MNNDMDQSIAFVGGIILIAFLLPMFLAWFDEVLGTENGLSAAWANVRQKVSTRWSLRRRP